MILLSVIMFHWFNLNQNHIEKFVPSARYNFLDDLTAKSRFLQVRADTANPRTIDTDTVYAVEMAKYLEDLNALKYIMQELSTHYLLQMVALLLFVIRILKYLQFQPRLGIITNTIAYMASDLIHFGVLFSIITFLHMLAGHYALGDSIEDMSEMLRVLGVMLNMLLGEIGVVEEIDNLPDTLCTAGYIWFWSWQVFAFFLLLNVLLAIIVDNYADMKEEKIDAIDATSVSDDLANIFSSMTGQFKDLITEHRTYINNSKLVQILDKLTERERAEAKVKLAVEVKNGILVAEEGEDKFIREEEVSKRGDPARDTFKLQEEELYNALLALMESHSEAKKVGSTTVDKDVVRRTAYFILRRFGEQIQSEQFAKPFGAGLQKKMTKKEPKSVGSLVQGSGAAPGGASGGGKARVEPSVLSKLFRSTGAGIEAGTDRKGAGEDQGTKKVSKRVARRKKRLARLREARVADDEAKGDSSTGHGVELRSIRAITDDESSVITDGESLADRIAVAIVGDGADGSSGAETGREEHFDLFAALDDESRGAAARHRRDSEDEVRV